MLFKTKLVSSLEKVFCDAELKSPEFKYASALRGEVFAFQVAFWGDTIIKNIKFEMESEISKLISIRSVGYVPCDYVGASFDDNVLRKTAGLYPDPLYPAEGVINALPFQWRALWITVRIPEKCKAGKYDITVSFLRNIADQPESCIDCRETFSLEILPVTLPKQQLLHTEWFHTDCIASYYQTECWSEKHWELIGKYAANAAAHGINMLLTPLWTPPLDTMIDGERPTTQLLIIEKKGSKYIFDFSRLKRWLDICLSAGIEYFEMSHFFTQWGAKFTPKIVVNENGAEKKLFGWHVSASDPEYENFLSQLMPQLLKLLRHKELDGKCFFHVSDEPSMENIEQYSQAAALVNNLVEDFPLIDALSNVDFYKRGIIKNPIPANNHIEPFVEAGVKPLWTYYCCGQSNKVSNRFFHFPSARNRIMGMLMFKYDIYGFLQWGFNFWYSQYSLDQKLDPFRVTDAGQAFQGGDAFMVYPGEDGPLDSLKYEVFMEGLQDMRALRLLEEKTGRGATVALLEYGLDYQLKMDRYPGEAAWLLARREKINRKLAELA
jgi:hypothetical protein